jgi:hypothetical protein
MSTTDTQQFGTENWASDIQVWPKVQSIQIRTHAKFGNVQRPFDIEWKLNDSTPQEFDGSPYPGIAISSVGGQFHGHGYPWTW